MQGKCGYERYERLYSGHKWWENMKIRMKNKTNEQKDLDRLLVEAIGPQNNYPNMDQIKNLVDQGAQMDHWVDYLGRANAMQLASINNSDNADQVIKFLAEKFDFITQEEEDDSPLSKALKYADTERSVNIIKMGIVTNPIFSLLFAGGQNSVEDQVQILHEIEKSYDFTKVAKDDLTQIEAKTKFGDDELDLSRLRIIYIFFSYWNVSGQSTQEEQLQMFNEIEKKLTNFFNDEKDDVKQIEDGAPHEVTFGDENFYRNVFVLFQFCQRKSSTILEDVFGMYNLSTPITWRFNKCGKLKWVAEDIQQRYGYGKVSIENNLNKLKVRF